MIHNSIEFYYRVAQALSEKAKEGRFDADTIHEIWFEDPEPVMVGPFVLMDNDWRKTYLFSFPDTDFAVGLDEESWDSWGHAYGNTHNNFDVFKKINPRIVYDVEEIYDIPQELRQKFPMPNNGGNSW